MKKVALSLATVLAAAAFAPEASAIPSFARQTGMACSACHFQHFPVLNGFGTAFKASGYTIMGAQGKVEGEHLSLPDTLNASILLKAQYVKTNGTVPATEISGQTTNSGQWRIPDELSLFFGGRIADSDTIKVGFMNENNMATGGPAGGMVAGFKLPIVVDLGAAKVMAIPFITDALGVAYGYEQSSTGLTRGVRWSEHRKEVSAAQYTSLGSKSATSGLALVVQSDMGYLNVTRYAPAFGFVTDMAGSSSGVSMKATWLRVAATPTVADWALHIGLGVSSGTGYNGDLDGTAAVAADEVDLKGNVFDVQAQGAVAGMETSVYFQTSTTPKSSATKTNLYNTATANDLKATTIGADFTVIPHALSVGAAYRKGEKATATDRKDDAITLTAVYDLFQNVAMHVVYSKYSGPSYTAGVSNQKVTGMLEAAW